MLCKQNRYWTVIERESIKRLIKTEILDSIEIVNVEITEDESLEKIQALYYSFPININISQQMFSSRLNKRSFDIFLNEFDF